MAWVKRAARGDSNVTVISIRALLCLPRESPALVGGSGCLVMLGRRLKTNSSNMTKVRR